MASDPKKVCRCDFEYWPGYTMGSMFLYMNISTSMSVYAAACAARLKMRRSILCKGVTEKKSGEWSGDVLSGYQRERCLSDAKARPGELAILYYMYRGGGLLSKPSLTALVVSINGSAILSLFRNEIDDMALVVFEWAGSAPETGTEIKGTNTAQMH